MRLTLDCRNRKYELTCTSYERTVETSGTLRPGAQTNAPPFNTTTILPDGSKLKLDWSPNSRGPASESQSKPTKSNVPSRTKSIRKKIFGKFIHFTRTQSCRQPEIDLQMEPQPRSYISELAETSSPCYGAARALTCSNHCIDSHESIKLAANMPELPGSIGACELFVDACELPEESKPDTAQQQPAHRYTHDEYNHNQAHRQPTLRQSPRDFAYQGYSQTMPASVSTLDTQKVFSINSHGVYSPQPLVTNAAMMPRAPPAVNPVLSSTPVSMVGTPIHTPHYHTGTKVTGQDFTWTNTSATYHGPFVKPLYDYPLSPPYQGQTYGVDISHSDSPTSSRRSSYTKGRSDPSASLPTPPAATPPNSVDSFGSTESPHHSFERLQSPPLPHPFNQPSLPAASVAATMSAQHSTYMGSHTLMKTSHWERPRNNAPPTQENYIGSMDSFRGHLPPPYDDASTVPHAAFEYTNGFFAPRNLFVRTARLSSIGDRLLPPLKCNYCDKPFTGRFQRGNRKRHEKSAHPTTDEDNANKICRKCGKRYRRADARRKHEWRKHGIEDCRPEPRCVEKNGEKLDMSNASGYI